MSNRKEYTLPNGKKAVFEYDICGIGKITLECMDELMSMIADTPQIVRCKECRFCKLEGDDEEGTHYLWCWKHDTDVNETDFCSWGERSE